MPPKKRAKKVFQKFITSQRKKRKRKIKERSYRRFNVSRFHEQKNVVTNQTLSTIHNLTLTFHLRANTSFHASVIGRISILLSMAFILSCFLRSFIAIATPSKLFVRRCILLTSFGISLCSVTVVSSRQVVNNHLVGSCRY